MISKSLENLIEATLVDGVLTDQEKEVLVKRAQKEGVDVDELDVYIQSILHKRQHTKAEVDTEKAKNSKLGSIKKCPNCGAMWVAGTAKCHECGYEFVGVKAVSSAVEFAEGLAKIMERTNKTLISADFSKSSPLGSLLDTRSSRHSVEKEVQAYITNFPVPSAKEDLLEFTMTMITKRTDDQFGDQYSQKLKECLTKAQVFFSWRPSV